MIRILCLALLTIGLVGPSLPARADDRNEKHERCEKRIHQAEDKLRDAVQRYGEDSRQARKRRENLKKRSGVAAITTIWITTTITTTRPRTRFVEWPRACNRARAISIAMILRAYFSAGAAGSPRL